jgi:hypothetical protein
MDNKVFNPMRGVVAESNSGGLPIGTYVGVFKEAEYLPEQEADAMTGEGGRKWAKIAFKWEIAEGEHKSKMAIRETPESSGVKSAFIAVCSLIEGKQLTASSQFDLTKHVGKKYLLTVSNKVKQDGTATNWTHVSNAMPMP